MEWNGELMGIVEPEPANTGLSEAVKERARVFGKWLWLYFWVSIISIVPGIIAAVEEMSETGTIIGTVIGWCFSGGLVYVMFRLGRVQDRLKICAGLNAILVAAQIILYFVGSEMVSNLWSIPSAILGMVVSYQLMHGCGDALVGVDNEQANKWYKLWKWYIGLLIAGLVVLPAVIMVSVVVENIAAAFALIGIVLVWAVMLIVQAVREYVYIYRTAKIFRGIAENL